MNEEDRSRRGGTFLVLFSGICWGCVGIFVRGLDRLGLYSTDIASMRALCAGIFLISAFAFAHREAFRIRLRDLWCMAGCGILSVMGCHICYFSAIRHTTVNIAVALLYTAPAFVMPLSMLCFRERMTARKILALIAVLSGCVLVSGVLSSGGMLAPKVLFWGLGSGFCYALYTIFGRFAQMKGYDSAAITLWTFIFAGGVSLFLVDWDGASQIVNRAGWHFWIPLAGLVLIATILPYCAYTAGLKRLTPSTASIVVTIDPLVGTLVGVMLFHESLSWSAATGLLFIIGATLLCGKR